MDTNSNQQNNNIGVLLVSHGSRLPYGREVINTLAQMYRETVPYKVEVGFMEIARPNIPEAMNKLLEGENFDKIVVMPVFLAGGVHINHDIPKILGLEDQIEDYQRNNNNHEHSHEHGHHHHHHDDDGSDITFEFDGEIIYTKPLGADPLVLQIIENRINDALKE